MRKWIFLYLFVIGLFIVADGQARNDAGQTIITLRATNPPTDSNILIVVNGKIEGTIREINKSPDKLFPPDSIEAINVIKGKDALEKYGEKGRFGVLEIKFKKANSADLPASKDTVTHPLTDEEKIFERVEVEASFPGGPDKWRQYLERNLNASVPVKNGAPEGSYTVIIQFVVDKEGSISDIRPLTKHGYGMEAEVMRVLIKGPKWTSAVQDGKKVKAYRKQPVTFVVMEEKEKKKKKDQ